MERRQPLTEVQNECFVRRKVQKTYGKKGKASAALESAKQIFIMPDDIVKKMAEVTIEEDQEPETQPSRAAAVLSQNHKKTGTTQSSDNYVPKAKAAQKPKVKSRVSLRKSSGRVSRLSDTLDKDALSKVDVHQPEHFSPEYDAIYSFAEQYSQHPILSFQAYAEFLASRCDIKKVGEGAFSSVFAVTSKPGANVAQSHHTVNDLKVLNGTTIFKVIPITMPGQEHRDDTTALPKIISEIQTMDMMTTTYGFINYRDVIICAGLWHESFLSAFRTFKTTQSLKADNDDPEEVFGSNQYYALLEMDDAGTEVADIRRPSDFQIFDIFWMTTMHLANGEITREFEHRDLHLSNVCIKPHNPMEDRMDVDEDTASKMIEPPKHLLGMSNIGVTLIDYTFSRATLPADETSRWTRKPINCQEPPKAFPDITKNTDLETRMQSWTYEKCRKMVQTNYAVLEKRNLNRDQKFGRVLQPWDMSWFKTNVCWLGHLLTCLLERAGTGPRTRYVKRSSKLAKEVQDEMRISLTEVKELLTVQRDNVNSLPSSATALLALGVEKGWVKQDDINGFRDKLEES